MAEMAWEALSWQQIMKMTMAKSKVSAAAISK
jgi:hypothetical protein